MPTLTATVADLLLERGPLRLDELHALALERGATRSKNTSSVRGILYDKRFVVRPDGRWDSAARLVRDQVFTTRVRRSGTEVLWTHVDLDPLATLPTLPLATGGHLTPGEGPVETWVGPAGWMSAVEDGQLLALRWDGAALHVSALQDVPRGDSDRVRDARAVLQRHAKALRESRYAPVPDSCLHVVVSALVEDGRLFAEPLPPLRELLPLPYGDLSLDPTGGRTGQEQGVLVEVPLPRRVHDELGRRAELIAERLPDYLSLLLGAAADRVQLAPLRSDRFEPYDDPWRPLDPARW